MRALGRTLLLVLLITGCDGERPFIANGEAAPEFALPQLTGAPTRLSALRGQVVAVRFWADWCRFCASEMRALEPEYARLAPRGLRLLAVNVGQDRTTVERAVARMGISYDILLDTDSAVASKYGVIALPVTFIIDRQGVVQGKLIGESDAASFARMVEPLL